MVKTNLTVTIDIDVGMEIQRRNINASQLVNNLLKTHFRLLKDNDSLEKPNNLESAKSQVAELIGQLNQAKKFLAQAEKEEDDKRKKKDAEYTETWQ